ncbi:hypothetical protein [Stutzerimonas xanthomarina]|uniref:Secreted protein n=2 Tax=Stutzerimonas xanthomarina TaxID=271420 RepID=A0A1M5K997_9GAMM|nr:hypothetical protein [Stutzerimonas xanthomarina]MCP9336986.1 hypothetical protein [Stutzerimonas xanthomarina]SEI05233.1 hypothetical protein SAMN05216535_3737 [Stutzerimonas xanthomarina]SHG49318.1 hypothetical protein SAMN02744645_0342 [Stutzerimonas xanthomarina DSM 18231]
MKSKYKWLIPGAVLLTTLGMAGCDVEKTEEGSLPDVEVEGGNMPEYDVDAPEVDVGSKEKVITVPDVDVTMPEDDEPDVGEPVEPSAPAPAPQN